MTYDPDAPEARPEPTPEPGEQQFATADAEALYANMRPDQRTAIANEFVRLFTLSGDPGARRVIGDVGPTGMDSPQQVAALHAYARDHAPDVLAAVWRHPVTQAALEAPGAPPAAAAADEREGARVAEALEPSENVAVTGAPWVSGGVMMEYGADRMARIIEDPRERSVGPEGGEGAEERVRRAEDEDRGGGA